ncbi:MAG: PD-(D/E)XK nuclease family protein [Acidobacteriota bacterium]
MAENPDGTLTVEHIRRPQLHASALEMKCAEAFRRRYIENEIIPPGVALIVGTGTHRSVERNLSHKVETGELLPVEAVQDHARDAVNHAWEGGVRLEPEELERGMKLVKGEAVNKAIRLSVLHHAEVAPGLIPTHVERPWSLEINGYPVDLVGRIDVQEGAESIRDTKTSGKTPSADCAQKSVQLKAYSLAVMKIDGAAPVWSRMDYLIDTKTPKSATFEAQFTDDDYRAVLARVETLCLAMERGVFIPVEPTHWACDPKWCGYALTCRYFVSKPKQFAI